MTAREFQREFERGVGYLDIPQDRKRIMSEDVNLYLNEAQDSIINKILSSIRDGIKGSQRRLDRIRTLLRKSQALTKNGTLSTDGRYAYDLPVDYLFLVGDRSCTSYCNTQYDNIQNRLVSSENIGEILDGSHTKPHYKSPVSELINTTLYVYRDKDLTFDINDVNIDYVKTYIAIDVIAGDTSELDASVHREIVSKAIAIFLESVNPERFRTNVEKVTLTEETR